MTGAAREPPVATEIASRNNSLSDAQRHQDDLLDESLEESFPASDPPSPKQTS
jgi:hypothetical protein